MSEAKKKPSVVKRRIDARIAWLKAGSRDHASITDNQKRIIPILIEEGATLVELAAMEGLPTVGAVYREMERDKVFAAAIGAARAAAATTDIDEAQHNLREALESNDTDRMAIAASYHKATLDYAAKIAPREYGQLVKLAGADGGALTINVTNYAELYGGPLQAIEASRETAEHMAPTQLPQGGTKD